jgi:alcohol dehydrogenase class IV
MNGRAVTQLPPFFIAVPTTAGTGAEATKVAVIKNNYNGLKKSIYHTTMIADVAILDLW